MMKALALRLVLSVACLSLCVCGSARKNDTDPELSSKLPLAVFLDKEISGNILGEELREPFGLAVDHRGSLYVTDAGNNRMISFDPNLNAQLEIGGYGRQPGLFDQPNFIVVDNDLNLLVSDAGNQRLVRYNSSLNYVDEINLVDDEALLKYGISSGIAVTDYGEVWMSDRQNNRIAVFDNAGRFDRFIGDFGYSGGQLSSPEKIIYGDQGHFIVCDAGNARIMIYDDYGNFLRRIVSDELKYPISLAVDKQQRYWVIDNLLGRLTCFSKTGELLLQPGSSLPGASRPLKNPSDIAVLPDGRLVVADTGNNRILVLRIIFDES